MIFSVDWGTVIVIFLTMVASNFVTVIENWFLNRHLKKLEQLLDGRRKK